MNIQKKRQTTVIMVSSTVYGIEDLLDQVYALLSGYGYEVWMSHKGTVPVSPHKTAFENCLDAVEKCDLFFCLITPYYGSGVVKNELSISHQELLKAISLRKPRWIMAHDHVSFTRTLLKNMGYKTSKERLKIKLHKKNIIDDLRIIDMYEAAIRRDIQVYKNKKGNWVPKYQEPADVNLFATAQFIRYTDVTKFLDEQFRVSRKSTVRKRQGNPK